MALPFYNWSLVAASNATADSTVNWAEGMAPSAVNDSARAMMASTAAFRDDISGAIATSGTSTAYTVSSNQVFDTLAHMDGAMIAFVPHTTCGSAPTLNVDSLGAKKIRFQTGADIPDGSLVEGTPYVVTYYNTVGEFILHNVGGYPYSIPLGSGIDHWGTTAPNSAFALAYGQAISRTTYAKLFTLFSTTYGSGDGSTTFNLPDKRGRVSAGKDDMGGTAASRLTSAGAVTGTTLGYGGGSQLHTLTQAQMPQHQHPFSGNTGIESNDHTHQVPISKQTAVTGGGDQGMWTGGNTTSGGISDHHTHPFSGTTSLVGSSEAHNNVQPTIICNYIIRVL